MAGAEQLASGQAGASGRSSESQDASMGGRGARQRVAANVTFAKRKGGNCECPEGQLIRPSCFRCSLHTGLTVEALEMAVTRFEAAGKRR